MSEANIDMISQYKKLMELMAEFVPCNLCKQTLYVVATINRLIILLLVRAYCIFSGFHNSPTLTWTSGSLTYVRDHSYACITQEGWAHRQQVTESAHFLLGKS